MTVRTLREWLASLEPVYQGMKHTTHVQRHPHDLPDPGWAREHLSSRG